MVSGAAAAPPWAPASTDTQAPDFITEGHGLSRPTQAALIGLAMPRIAIGELTVHYQQTGAGPDLLLIHGLCCNLAFWYLTVVPKLAETYRVTVYDLRGHGLTRQTPRGYRAIDLAGDLGQLLDHLGIASVHVVGHSFGGAVALAFAIRWPERVRTLMLADSWVPSLQRTPVIRRPGRWPELQSQLRRSGFRVEEELPAVVHEFVEEVVGLEQLGQGGAGEGPGQVGGSHALDMLLNRNGESAVLRRWRQLIGTTAAVDEFSDQSGIGRAEIATMGRPTSLVFGQQSRYLPTMRVLRRTLRNCRSIVVPQAGHYFPVLRPLLFTKLVEGFAAEPDGGGAGGALSVPTVDTTVMRGEASVASHRGDTASKERRSWGC
jgi:pimeloyl-ACP methyl ester carboxylesterase